MNITTLHPPGEQTIYHVPEPDAMHPHVGWYFETAAGFIRGVFDTENAAFQAAAKEIEL